MTWHGRTVWITGASSGIGAALAPILAERGATVGIAARRANRLEEVLERCKQHSPDSRMWSVDLSDLDAAVKLGLDAWDAFGGLDAVIHNAAIPKRVHTSRMTYDDVDETMNINFASPVRMTMALLPITKQEERETLNALRDYGRFCDRFAGPLLEEMSTENVARDLDRMRAAVGDKQLNFLGFSYGTLIGATYVNMFPNRSRAIVIDGNVDPNLRLHDGLEYDRQRTNGFEISLDAFLRKCDAAGEACAFSDGNPRAKFDELRTYLRRTGPITLPDGSVVAIDTFTDAVAGTLYDLTALADLAAALQEMYDVIHPPAAAATQRRAQAPTQSVQAILGNAKQAKLDIRPDTPYSSDDSYAAVNCTDKPFRNKASQIPAIADQWERQLPTFGRYLAWADPAICPNWPLDHRDVYSGPWNRRTPNPVLVYGNFYDPATQYEFARRMTRELGNARLVSVDAFGHTILGFSACADDIATSYLIELTAPRPGIVCQPDIPPFPTSA